MKSFLRAAAYRAGHWGGKGLRIFQSRFSQYLRWFWSLMLIAVILMVGYQVYRHWEDIKAYPWQLDLQKIIWAFLLYTLGLFASALVWGWIINRFALPQTLSVFTHWRLFTFSNLANRLPTPLFFVSARMEAYGKLGVARSSVLTAMSIEYMITILGGTLVALFTLPFALPYLLKNDFQLTPGWIILWGLVGLALILIVLSPKLLVQMINTVRTLFKRKKLEIEIGHADLLKWGGGSVLIWLNAGFINLNISQAFYPISSDILLLMTNVIAVSGVLAWLGQVFFFMPSSGIRQVTVAYLLSLVMPWPVAIAVSILSRVTVQLFEIIWALVWLVIDKLVESRQQNLQRRKI